MGGRVALKGTDGPEALALARARGAVPVAPERAARALAALARSAGTGAVPPAAPAPAVEVLAAPGSLGEDLATAAGLPVTPTGEAAAVPLETSALDTRAAVAAMAEQGVDLVLFAGGDGTARDIVDAIGDAVPLVGIPTGVKMHSGVFAATPDAAGATAAAYLRDPDPGALRDADVADVDEDAVRAGRVATRLYGRARVPRQPMLMLGAKSSSGSGDDRELDALCAALARDAAAAPDRLTLLGPGTTTARVLTYLGHTGTVLGVDALRGDQLVASDLDEAGLLALLDQAGAPDPAAPAGPEPAPSARATLDASPGVRLILGVVGGQGSLLGRGNQQLSARVLRRIGAAGIEVVAAADKLLALDPPALRVDTGDDGLDAELSGYRRVRVAPGRTIVMKVST